MRILGLDLGLTTGWCRLKADTSETCYGEWKIGSDKDQRLVDFESNMIQVVRDFYPDLVVFEKVQFVRSRAQITLVAQLEALVRVTCARPRQGPGGIVVIGVPVGTLKKFATGDGRAKKPEMIEAAQRVVEGRVLWSTDQMTDNEADAIHLAMYGAERLHEERAA